MRRHSANPEFKPRASRKKLNPYIQFQKKKEATRQQWDEAEVMYLPACMTSVAKLRKMMATKDLFKIILQHGPNPNEPVITEEELEELRRRQAEMVEEEVAKSFPFKSEILEEEEEEDDEDEEELDECWTSNFSSL